MEQKNETWYFTFGMGHKLAVINSDYPTVATEQTGFSLANFYVRITGSYTDARKRMISQWGNMWCNQYNEDEFKRLARKYDMRELVINGNPY